MHIYLILFYLISASYFIYIDLISSLLHLKLVDLGSTFIYVAA